MIVLLAVLTLTAFVLYFLRKYGTGIAILSGLLLAATEGFLVYWLAKKLPRILPHSPKQRRQWNVSRVVRRMNIAEHAVKGRAYSQHMVLMDLKSMLTDRISAVRMMSHRELREKAMAEGKALFTSELLYTLYIDRIMETDGWKFKPLSGEEFTEVFNNIVGDMRRKS